MLPTVASRSGRAAAPGLALAAALAMLLLCLRGARPVESAQTTAISGWALPFSTSLGTSVPGYVDDDFFEIKLPSTSPLTLFGTNIGTQLWASSNGFVSSSSGSWYNPNKPQLAPWAEDLVVMPDDNNVSGSKLVYALLSRTSGGDELERVARFLAQPLSRIDYAVLVSWVKVGFWGSSSASIQSTFQALIAKGTDGTTYTCFFYERLSLEAASASMYGIGMSAGGNVYTLTGGLAGEGALSAATTSGGWYQIGQQARPGTWCFTAHEACAATPQGCSPDVYPSTNLGSITCPGPNSQPGLALGGARGATQYADCVCSAGFYVRPGTNILTQGCANRTADCISGVACPGVNSVCNWQSGSNACTCKTGWQVAPGESLDVHGCRLDINECFDTANCIKPNTVCINTPGNYSCICADGYVLAPGTDARIQGCVLPACAAPPAQPLARGTWACAGSALQSGDSCAGTCNEGFVGAPTLACTRTGSYAAIAFEQCLYNNSAGLPTFYLTVEGPLASFPPLTDATLATFATQIAAGLNLPPPYSAANLVTWFERATLDASTGQQVLRVVVGYAVMPEAAQSIPLLAIADSPTTVVSIADGLHSAASFVTDPAAALVITASDAAGHARGTAVPISADCAVSLVTPDASPSACAGDASVSASFRFSGRHVQGATTFTATLGGNVCTLPAVPLQGSQTKAAVLVECSTPSTVGVHNLSVAATYTADSGCASGTVAAQMAVRVHALPTVTVTPALASVLVCAGSNAILEFAYGVNMASDEPVQLLPSVSGAPATCSVVRQGTNQAGKLVVTCSGAFGPQAAPMAVTATLVATTVTGCSASASAAATVNGLCCRVANTVAYAGLRSASKCFSHVDPTDVHCRARPQVSRYGWVNKGELEAGSLQPDLTGASCASASAPVGTVAAKCRASDGALVFTVRTSRLSAASLRYWVGCLQPVASAAPAAAARTTRLAVARKAKAAEAAKAKLLAGRGLRAVQACNVWRELPAVGTSNAVELSVNTDAETTTTTWVWKPAPLAGAHCDCADVFWAVHATGMFAEPTGGSC